MILFQSELYCLQEIQTLLGMEIKGAVATNGAGICTRASDISCLSAVIVNYNFPKAMKNNFTDYCTKHLRPWVARHHIEELEEGENSNWDNFNATTFLHHDVTPEFLMKQIDPDAPHRTSASEVFIQDEFAAVADQFGMMGSKGKADEKNTAKPMKMKS